MTVVCVQNKQAMEETMTAWIESVFKGMQAALERRVPVCDPACRALHWSFVMEVQSKFASGAVVRYYVGLLAAAVTCIAHKKHAMLH